MADEKDRLMRDMQYLRDKDENEEEKRLSKTRLFLCCFCCLLTVIFVILLAWLFTGSIPLLHRSQEGPSEKHGKEIKSGSGAHGAVGAYAHNVSEMESQNAKLCSLVTSNRSVGGVGGGEATPGSGNIYIVKDERNLTSEQACGVESVLRLFPDKTVYLIDFSKKEDQHYNKCSCHPNYLGLLMLLYKDRLQLLVADRTQFFQYTPLQNHTSHNDSFVFMAMLVAAYKYGGLVTSPDVVMVNRDLVECFPEETVLEPFAILAPKKCDEFLYYLMQSFALCGSVTNLTLESVLTEGADLYSRSQPKASARRLGPHELCSSHDHLDSSCTFLRLHKFQKEEEKRICELSAFCKQVVQAYYGIRINKMQVAEETSKIKSSIRGHNCAKKGSKPTSKIA